MQRRQYAQKTDGGLIKIAHVTEVIRGDRSGCDISTTKGLLTPLYHLTVQGGRLHTPRGE